MAVDIEAPGANETVLKAALRDLVGGWVPISTTTVSSQTASVDISLPVAYSHFILEIRGLAFTGSDLVTFQFSSNGGSSFHSGATDYNSQRINISNVLSDSGAQFDSCGYLCDDNSIDVAFPQELTAYINPGSDSCVASVKNVEIWIEDLPRYSLQMSFLELFVAEEPNHVRMNMIRIGGYLAGGGEDMTAGTFTLLGLVAP